MQSIIDDIGLMDIMKHRHDGSLPATYARGQRCLAYALATPHVINAVEQAGYEAFNARYQTDHRAHFVDPSTDKLFGIQIQPLSKHEPRVLKAIILKQVTAYIKAKHKYLEAHNVFDRMKRLELSGNRHKYAEKIDKDVEAASLAAEKSIPHFDQPFWSVELSQARKRCKYQEMFINGADSSRQLGSHISGVARSLCISRDTQNDSKVQRVIERLESTSPGIGEVKLRDT